MSKSAFLFPKTQMPTIIIETESEETTNKDMKIKRVALPASDKLSNEQSLVNDGKAESQELSLNKEDHSKNILSFNTSSTFGG